MHLHSLYFYTFASCASALWIQPDLKASGPHPRSNPSFIDVHSHSGHNTSLHRTIIQRTDPSLNDGDYGKTDGVNRKELLKGAFPDVYTLVMTALNHWDDVIFDHWFPARDKQKVMNVLGSIIKSQDAPPGDTPTEGADILKYFMIEPVDTLAGSDNDLCAQGADAYTINFIPTDGGGGNPDYAVCHFCPFTYEDDLEEPVAPTLDDLRLSDFEFGTGFRITNEMEPIAATVLHELMHFNTIGSKTELPPVEEYKAIIVDVGGPNPDTDYGEPYWAWQLRGDVTDDHDPCLKNADSYVWFALESYWTYTFKDELKDQGGYFNPPKKLSDDQVLKG